MALIAFFGQRKEVLSFRSSTAVMVADVLTGRLPGLWPKGNGPTVSRQIPSVR